MIHEAVVDGGFKTIPGFVKSSLARKIYAFAPLRADTTRGPVAVASWVPLGTHEDGWYMIKLLGRHLEEGSESQCLIHSTSGDSDGIHEV